MNLDRYSTEDLRKILVKLARSNRTNLVVMIISELNYRSIFKTKIYEKI
jgi:hypothetical protein